MNKLITLSGSAPLDEVHFRSARLHEALSENSTGTVYLESDSATLDADEFLGKTFVWLSKPVKKIRVTSMVWWLKWSRCPWQQVVGVRIDSS